MAIYRIKRFTYVAMNDGSILNAASSSATHGTQADYNALFGNDKLFDKSGNATELALKQSKANNVGSSWHSNVLDTSKTPSAGAIRNAAYKQGAAAGQKSVGMMGGLKNTWNRAGTMGKAGMVAGGVAAAGLMAKGVSSMFGNKKDN